MNYQQSSSVSKKSKKILHVKVSSPQPGWIASKKDLNATKRSIKRQLGLDAEKFQIVVTSDNVSIDIFPDNILEV